jgi:phenylpropionate dioxygenase-like ring-hydroxylating dioxygenase large terminal subunit
MAHFPNWLGGQKVATIVKVKKCNSTPAGMETMPMVSSIPGSISASISAPNAAASVVQNLAGGADPDRFDPTEAWYPVFYLRDLDPLRPNAFTLLDVNLVIWWERSSQTWRAFEDQCPHRLVPLSEGRIADDGLLECPYHGWAFGGEGDCQRIPQAEEDSAKTSPRACVRSFPTAIAQGLLFVYPGKNEAVAMAIPTITPMDEMTEGWTLFDISRDLPYDAVTLLENVLDPSHLPYTHHNSVGNRVNAAAMELLIEQSDRQGFRGRWPEGPRKGTMGPQDTVFIAPNLMWHDLTSKQFGRTITAVYATPTRKGECRLFARFPFRFNSKIPALAIALTPRWYSHLGQNAILEDDQIFLHHQERYLAAKVTAGNTENISKAFYLPAKSDRFVFEFRQWFAQFQADPFPGQMLPPVQSRDQLLDRYHSHTAHCASCRNAVRRIGQIRLGLAATAITALAVAPMLMIATATTATPTLTWAIVNGVVAIVASFAWWGLGQFSQGFHRGHPTPARNRLKK